MNIPESCGGALQGRLSKTLSKIRIPKLRAMSIQNLRALRRPSMTVSTPYSTGTGNSITTTTKPGPTHHDTPNNQKNNWSVDGWCKEVRRAKHRPQRVMVVMQLRSLVDSALEISEWRHRASVRLWQLGGAGSVAAAPASSTQCGCLGSHR